MRRIVVLVSAILTGNFDESQIKAVKRIVQHNAEQARLSAETSDVSTMQVEREHQRVVAASCKNGLVYALSVWFDETKIRFCLLLDLIFGPWRLACGQVAKHARSVAAAEDLMRKNKKVV